MKNFRKGWMGDRRRPDAEECPPPAGREASQALVDLASESWRLAQQVRRAVPAMEPMAAERFMSQFEWYMRKVHAVLDEAGLRAVDLTGEKYTVGLAVTPLNLEDFPESVDMRFRIAQMVEPVIMENNRLRKPGTVMLSEELEEQ